MSDIVERLREYCGSPYCIQLRAEAAAEIERLREEFKLAGDAVEQLSFEMPPPSEYTPRFVMLAQALRRCALEGK
jgi:hypothetical protein